MAGWHWLPSPSQPALSSRSIGLGGGLLAQLSTQLGDDFWPRVAANVSGILTQEGGLHGIEGATESHNLQLNPYALAQTNAS